jgi:cytochrome c oxidase subunit IV
MSEKSHSHASTYYKVFGSLLVLTIITVGVSYLHLGIVAAITVAMIVALTKGSLVAAYFMHLVGEKKVIFWVLLITIAFFAVLLAVPTMVFVEDYRMNP